jgi:hypothetical protein
MVPTLLVFVGMIPVFVGEILFWVGIAWVGVADADVVASSALVIYLIGIKTTMVANS